MCNEVSHILNRLSGPAFCLIFARTKSNCETTLLLFVVVVVVVCILFFVFLRILEFNMVWEMVKFKWRAKIVSNRFFKEIQSHTKRRSEF